MISIQKKKFKTILLSLLICLLFFLIVLIMFFNGSIKIFYNAIKGKKTEKNIISDICINNVSLTYDSDNNLYYLPINLENNSELPLEIKLTSSKIINSKIEDKNFCKKITLYKKIDYGETLEISVESLLYKYNCVIKFTNIPIISLNYDEDKIGDEYIYSKISITDPDYISNNSVHQFSSNSKIRYRGNFTRILPKKSYRIKLDKSTDFGILGINSNETLILDSLVTDDSNIRTKIASDLWNNINSDLATNKYAKLNCKYVEVYVNNSYRGLYLLKDAINENLLNLDTDTGILLKGINWNSLNLDDYNNISSDSYGPFELKYPKNPKKYSQSWVRILDRLKDFYSGNISYQVINDTFYIENLENHRIFLLALGAQDNYEFKNIYYSLQNNNTDSKVLITPWDVDLTFGLLFDENLATSAKSYDKVNSISPPYALNSDIIFKQKLKERWKLLSNSELSKDSITTIINQQYEYLTKSDTIERENKKYNNVNIANEIQEIKDWYYKRFEIIDNYINSL